MKWIEKDLEIRYADTDMMGVIHHSVYPLYAELARLELCVAIGLPYHEMESRGYFLMVGDMNFRFLAPATLGDPIYIKTRLSKLHKRLMIFEYEIRRRDNEQLICTGNTKHIVTRRLDGPGSMPEDMYALFLKGFESAH